MFDDKAGGNNNCQIVVHIFIIYPVDLERVYQSLNVIDEELCVRHVHYYDTLVKYMC